MPEAPDPRHVELVAQVFRDIGYLDPWATEQANLFVQLMRNSDHSTLSMDQLVRHCRRVTQFMARKIGDNN